jgi:DNA-binding NarL/FixJ family response regulator
MIRVLLADDHDVVRQGLHKLLEDHEDWEVCGEASNGREAVDMAKKLKPDVAVIDLSMPELNGLEATREIRKELPETEVLVLTMHENDELIRESLIAGARGYVLKTDAGRRLVDAIEALSRHQPFFTARVSATLLDAFREYGAKREKTSVFNVLTDRERRVIQLLAEGKRSKQIASLLGISVKTVESHRATIMRKLGFHSVTDLVHYAIRNMLVEA